MSPFVRQDVVDGEGHVANVQGQWLVPAGRGHLRGGGRPARSRDDHQGLLPSEVSMKPAAAFPRDQAGPREGTEG